MFYSHFFHASRGGTRVAWKRTNQESERPRVTIRRFTLVLFPWPALEREAADGITLPLFIVGFLRSNLQDLTPTD